jgi:hypothetical protein
MVVAALLFANGCTCTAPAKQTQAQTAPDAGTPRSSDEAPALARGMWVWKTRARMPDPAFKATLLETCARAHLNELYLSVSAGLLDDVHLGELVTALREAGVRVEALMGEAAWYQPEKRAPMLALIDAVASYNDTHPRGRFSGVHLDIEPHQLAENRGARHFLPALVETLKAASELARRKQLTTSADLPRFAFEESGAALAGAVDRPFVMLYELHDKSSQRLVAASAAVIEHTYRGLAPDVASRLVVGLSVDDYPAELEARLAGLDAAHGKLVRYGGWAIHDEAKYRARPVP